MKNAITLYLTKENDKYQLSAHYDVETFTHEEQLVVTDDLDFVDQSVRSVAQVEESPLFIVAAEGLDQERSVLEKAVNC